MLYLPLFGLLGAGAEAQAVNRDSANIHPSRRQQLAREKRIRQHRFCTVSISQTLAKTIR
jgi:hypothetical protein